MAESMAACDWGRARPSRSRTQGAAFGGAKGKPEDAEMRSVMRVIQACEVVDCAISLTVWRDADGAGMLRGDGAQPQPRGAGDLPGPPVLASDPRLLPEGNPRRRDRRRPLQALQSR